MEKKRCSKCKEWKILDCFGKCKRNKDGLQYRCKECRKEYYGENKKEFLKREWKRSIKLENLKRNKKECSKCKELKTLECFSKNKASKDGLCSKCKECVKEYNEKNKDRISKQRKEYRKNNSEKILKQRKYIYIKHKPKILKKQKEYYKDHKSERLEYKKEYNKLPVKFNSKANFRREIELYEEDIRESEEGFIECKCAYCGDWFAPTYINIQNRVSAMNTENQGEQRLYCSEACKQACPIYNQTLYPKGFKPATSREVQPELRQMVLDRDNYTCQRCDKTKDELSEEGIALHCHHLEGIQWEPLMSADIDMCITYCQPCHVKAHQQPDCGYHDMQCIY